MTSDLGGKWARLHKKLHQGATCNFLHDLLKLLQVNGMFHNETVLRRKQYNVTYPTNTTDVFIQSHSLVVSRSFSAVIDVARQLNNLAVLERAREQYDFP